MVYVQWQAPMENFFPRMEFFFHPWKKNPWMEKKGFPGSLKLTLQLIGMFLKCSQPLTKELHIAGNIVKDVSTPVPTTTNL